jgi:hypothetical protein
MPQDLLDDLVTVAAELSNADRTAVRSVVDTLLAVPADGLPAVRGRSGLNGNGAPLEVCLSAFADACRVRLIADPASAVGDPLRRRDEGVRALRAALGLTMSSALGPLCDATLDINLPSDETAIREYIEGVAWIGAGVGFPGVALYVDATRGDRDLQWQRTTRWLETVVRQPGPALSTIGVLRDRADLMAVGVEGFAPENARAKMFWRLREPGTLADLGAEAFRHPDLLRFLQAAVGPRELPVHAFVFSTSFLAANGMPFDAKIDLCAHCLDLDDAAWITLVSELTAALSLAPIDVARALDGGRAQPAFLGLNVSPMGNRLDLFLRPSRWYEEEVAA